MRSCLVDKGQPQFDRAAPFSHATQTTHFKVHQGGTPWQRTHPGQIFWSCGIPMARLIRFVRKKQLPCSPMSRSMRSGRSPKNLSYPRINWFSAKARPNSTSWLSLEAALSFLQPTAFGQKNIPVVRLPERSFTGDLSFFTNTPLVGDGRTTGATRILRVRHSDFRRLLSAEPDLAAVILRAFVLRQSFKFRHGVGAVVLIGKASDPDILKLRTFLSRSDYPHNLIRARCERRKRKTTIRVLRSRHCGSPDSGHSR